MEENIDLSRKKSIDDIIQRAREEKVKAISLIEFLLSDKVPAVFDNVQAIIDNFTQMAKMLEVDYQENNQEIQNLRESCILTLNDLKMKIENAGLTEEELLTSDVIGNSYTMIEEISRKIDIIPRKILERGKSEIIDGISKKTELNNKQNELISKKEELEKQEMYLKGMLEVIILGKKKKELEERILKIRAEIKEIDKLLISTNSFRDNNNEENSEKNGNIEFK